MKLWLISQNVNKGYDTFDSAVVVAASPEEAKGIHPSGDQKDWIAFSSSWASHPDQVNAIAIGKPLPGFDRPGRVICASFKAG